jgi:hypothetical protein
MLAQQMTLNTSVLPTGHPGYGPSMAVFSYHETALLFQIIWLQEKTGVASTSTEGNGIQFWLQAPCQSERFSLLACSEPQTMLEVFFG